MTAEKSRGSGARAWCGVWAEWLLPFLLKRSCLCTSEWNRLWSGNSEDLPSQLCCFQPTRCGQIALSLGFPPFEMGILLLLYPVCQLFIKHVLSAYS